MLSGENKMPEGKIMLFDDKEIIRMFYRDELKDEGYEFVSYESPANCIEKINRENPDLVLLDIKFPEYDGLDVLGEIRKNVDTWNLPIILISAYSSFKGDLKSIAADYYVVKSSDLTKLKSRIRKCLEDRV